MTRADYFERVRHKSCDESLAQMRLPCLESSAGLALRHLVVLASIVLTAVSSQRYQSQTLAHAVEFS